MLKQGLRRYLQSLLQLSNRELRLQGMGKQSGSDRYQKLMDELDRNQLTQLRKQRWSQTHKQPGNMDQLSSLK